MLNLATETDIERLRQAALLLEQENGRLFRRPETLATELREARGEETRGRIGGRPREGFVYSR